MSHYLKQLERYKKRREKIAAMAAKIGIRATATKLGLSTQRVNQIVKAAK